MRRTTEDRITLGFLAFSLLLAFTLELYFILHFDDIHRQNHLFADLFSIYAAGDRSYFGQGDIHFPLALETLHVCVTQLLNALIAVAVLRGSPYRYPLQLAVSSYVSYSVVLYFWTAVLDGYAHMPEKTAWGYFIFYAPNLPWLAGNLLLAWFAFRAVLRRFRTTGPGTGPASGADPAERVTSRPVGAAGP
ncbi:hypothetical protein [Streptomyces gobitricini]|uniref:EXPERA domain-containing protein n=1 Tax=Streptomyces gobitricini TaxID=68211 RepID=A0ABN3MZV8_9ACTN